jgi:hypothetical protein
MNAVRRRLTERTKNYGKEVDCKARGTSVLGVSILPNVRPTRFRIFVVPTCHRTTPQTGASR